MNKKMEENITIEEKATEIANEVAQETDYKDTAAYEAAMKIADFVIDKAETWLRENATDYLDKIEDCTGGNEWESQTFSFPEEFFTRFKKEIKMETNKTITEDYVSFETAKLLKEKGFRGNISMYYKDNGNGVIQMFSKITIDYGINEGIFIQAPTLQMAMKWLREVHHIFIQVELYSKRNDYCFNVFKNTKRILIEYLEVCNSYEEAVEAAIKYCLTNLID